ncbi:MAG TPA: hypothetical protein VGI03_01815 [Verrucomicrobiae bacterium]
MKLSTKIASALLALGLVTQASADPTVYLTGSSAFRTAVFDALSDNTDGTNAGGLFDTGTVTYATFGSSSASGATYMVFHGNINGAGIYVDCAFSGSEAGIASACNSTLNNPNARNGATYTLSGSPETWVNPSNAVLQVGGNVVTANPNGANGGTFEASSHGADLAQADTSQAISWTPFVAGTQTALNDYGSEGVVTFTWSKNVNPAPSNEWTHVSNITLPQINSLLANGALPAGFFSGNTNDNDFTVYLVGRNRGSGTRMNIEATSTYGAHKQVLQYSVGFGVDPNDPAQATGTLWLTNENNNGYESGGGVAKALSDTGGSVTVGSCQQADPFNGGKGWFALGYVSPADALNAGNNGGEPTNNWVTVDGAFSNNGNIETGPWWFWGHEHLYGKFQISGIQNTVGSLLYTAVSKTLVNLTFGVDPNGHDLGIPYTLMHVHKTSDTSFPVFGQVIGE